MIVHKVKYAGETYDIPDIWLCGFTQDIPGREPRTILDAIKWWHYQATLEKM